MCSKSFKNQKSFANHEKSKKHLEAVEALRLELLAQDAALDDVTNLNSIHKEAGGIPTLEEEVTHIEDMSYYSDEEEETSRMTNAKKKKQKKLKKKSNRLHDDDDDAAELAEELSNLHVAAVMDDNATDAIETGDGVTDSSSIADNVDKVKKAADARKLRKEKRKEKKKVTASEVSAFQCKTCSAVYTSKSLLFDHLEETDHAVVVADKGSSRRKGKK